MFLFSLQPVLNYIQSYLSNVEWELLLYFCVTSFKLYPKFKSSKIQVMHNLIRLALPHTLTPRTNSDALLPLIDNPGTGETASGRLGHYVSAAPGV